MCSLTGLHHKLQMYIRRVCLPFAFCSHKCLYLYKWLVTFLSKQVFSSFSKHLKNVLTFVCAMQKSSAVKLANRHSLSTGPCCRASHRHIQNAYLASSPTLQGTSWSLISLKHIIRFQIHHMVFLVSSHRHITPFLSLSVKRTNSALPPQHD